MASTLTSPDGATEVITARRTESIDAPHILKLVQKNTETLFGKVNVISLIEKAVLAITLVNGKGDILGHAAFFDYPNIANVDPANWEQWMSQFYTTKHSALNTLFMNFFVAKSEYANGCAREIIRTAFNTVPDVHFCFLVVPKDTFPEEALADFFEPLKKTFGVKGPEDCTIFVTHRHKHAPVLHIRKAHVEDTDDLVPLFNSLSDTLKATYGDFYLAELIDAQNEHMHCLVAEVAGHAVGLMSINDNVDLDFLNQCYELGSFNGLKRTKIEDILTNSLKFTDKNEERHEGDDASTLEEWIQSDKIAHKKKQNDSTPLPPADGDSLNMEEAFNDSQVQFKLSDIHMRSDSKQSFCQVTPSLLNSTEQDSPAMASTTESTTVGSATISQYPRTPTGIFNQNIPIYKGELNAFCIQLFAIDDKYEMRSEDFLSEAFRMFPNVEMCIITVPHLVPEFPLLQQFVRATPRLSCIPAHELYIFHKSGLIKDFTVRKACISDLGDVELLINYIYSYENILNDLKQFNKARRDKDGTEIQAFVAVVLQQIVGIAIIRDEEDIEYIRAHYNIEDYIYFSHHQYREHGHLYHMVLNPAFKYLTKYFIKEILRQGHKTSLYYPLYPPYVNPDTLGTHSLITALSEMVPVTHRRQIIYPSNLESNAPSEHVLKKMSPFALTHINRKLTLEPKVTINARIVVVGASTVGLSFLETLTYCPHLNFNNLTLVSSHGLLGELPPDPLRDGMMASNFCYDQDENAKIALRTWVNVVHSKMTRIDRKRKFIVVSPAAVIPYDHLILCCGQQYCKPSSAPGNNSCPTPNNVFVINNASEATSALEWIKQNILDSQGGVVVYGDSIDTFCCVQTLLTLGIAGNRINLVLPLLTNKISCFNNCILEKALLDTMQKMGIQVHTNCKFQKWNEDKNNTDTNKVYFQCPNGHIEIEYVALFCYQEKRIDNDAFRAINDSCLVFDGKLAIDSTFHTNDVSIRAAGTLTKYHRKFYADKWIHSNFNSKEVGIALATEMLKLFDPIMQVKLDHDNENGNTNLVPIYRTPKMIGALLPGGFHYLHLAKPGENVPLEQCSSEPGYGQVLVTGNPTESSGYFCVHLNKYNSVETITCFRKKPFPATNFIHLYGIHERILNNMLSRYNGGLITDFFSFFMEPWCVALYHDRFQDIREEIRHLLSTETEEGNIYHKLQKLLENNAMETFSLKDAMDFLQLYKSKKYPCLSVESHLLSYLSYNYYHLPMYAKPGIV